MLRVIAGEHGGRKLKQPDTEDVRPTMDRVKEAVFSSIQFKVPGAIVLDLFAGSGSLAIESISRGAMKAFAVDNNKKSIDAIKANKETLRLNNLEVRKADAITFARSMAGTKFDIIFLDPPYKEFDLYNSALEAIKNGNLLSSTGFIVVETENKSKIEIPEGLVVQKSKDYGKTSILVIANNI